MAHHTPQDNIKFIADTLQQALNMSTKGTAMNFPSGVNRGHPPHPVTPSTHTRIGGLDFVRGQAVLLVMAGHAAEAVPSIADTMGVVSGLGVKIFFVLSGFLITKLLINELNARQRIDFRSFYIRRAARLMPAFYLYLLTAIAAVTLRGNPLPWDAIAASMLYITNYYQAFTGAAPNLVAHCWSLAVEEQFYFIWPICCHLLFRKNLSFTKYLTIFIITIWCWRLFLLLIANASADYLYRALDTRADELIVGCLLAVFYEKTEWRDRIHIATKKTTVRIILIPAIYALTYIDGQNVIFKYSVGYMIEPFIIALLVVLSIQISSGDGIAARIINSQLLTHIGKVSYGMYLFHGLIMHAVQRAAEARGCGFWLSLTMAISMTYAFAALSFRWFETPMSKWIQLRWGRT